MEEYLRQLSERLSEKDIAALLLTLNKTALVSATDDKGTIIYANEKFISASGYSLDELLGQNHRILKSGHQPDTLFKELWSTISAGKMWRGEIKNRAKDGTYYWVDSSIVPVIGKSGGIERYISIRLLITDKKEIEEKVQTQMAEMEAINKAMVGRELKMLELKERISQLEMSLKSCMESHKVADL